MSSIIQKIQNRVKQYQKRNEYQTIYTFDNASLDTIIPTNRQSLDLIKQWFDDDMLNSSIFRYGITDNILDKINLPIDDTVTYTDMLCYLSKKLSKPVNYMEIGVSVGKTLFQLLNYFQHSNLVGFEIEEINPYMSKMLKQTNKKEWPTKADSIKKSFSSITSFDYRTNKLDYYSADVWDENSWSKLQGRKFNVIFSDALHDERALLYEYEMIEKYNLLDETEFVMAWDDLEEKMVDSFIEIKKRMAKRYGVSKKNTYIIPINGWIGNHWGKHHVGIITTL